MTPKLNRVIMQDETYKLMINVCGLNNENTIEIATFSLEVYAFDKKLIFSKKLGIEQARELYSFLSQFSIIKDNLKIKTGQIVELTDNKREIIENLISADDKDEIVKQILQQTPDKNYIIEQILADTENIEKIYKIGGSDLLKQLVDISIFTKETKNLVVTLQEIFEKIKGEDRIELLETIKKQKLSKEDLDILNGRKEGLEIFRRNLFEETNWDEKDWQKFFENNTWIFGYGLDYKFLTIIQREAHVSNTDLDGKNSVITDFILGSNKFTVLVELKRPDTKLFDTKKNRSESWSLSSYLTNSISQILTQKAEWEIKSQTEQYDIDENPIRQRTIDPKTILIIGNSVQYEGETKTDKIKAKTFELYRRNMKNVEIITYDELYQKANFIVNQNNKC